MRGGAALHAAPGQGPTAGAYQHWKEKHLHRYLAEFDFRYNNRIALGVDDVQRSSKALQGVKDKRLTYRTTGGEPSAVEITRALRREYLKWRRER